MLRVIRPETGEDYNVIFDSMRAIRPGPRECFRLSDLKQEKIKIFS